MKRMLSLLLVTVVGLSVLTSGALTAPTPSPVPMEWELTFTPVTAPRPVRFRPPGASEDQTYWYVVFTVTNTTGEDQVYIPEFTLYTDTGQVLNAGQGVPTGVFAKVKEMYNLPLMRDMTSITGRLLQGRDNARTGVAIFRDIDPNAASFEIFVGGLSGETVLVQLPRPVEVTETTVEGDVRTVERDSISLIKTLQLSFRMPGEAAARFVTEPKLVKRMWVMR